MVRRGKVFESCLHQLEAKAHLPILESKISMRNVFPESQIYGCIVSSFGESTAATEVRALAKEVAGLLGFDLKKVNKI